MSASTIIDPKAVVQVLTFDESSLKLPSPFSMCISGPSQSGKSSFFCQLIENRKELFSVDYARIILCQHEELAHRPNEIFDRLKKSFIGTELVSGLPNITRLRLDLNPQTASLLIIDDLQSQLMDSKEMIELLTVKSHHMNISVIFTMQNYFAPSKFGKVISRNCHFKVFFYNRLDLTELRHISLQITPTNSTFLQSCFNFLTEKFPNDSNYIFINGHYRSKVPQFVVSSHIFPNEHGKIEPIIFFSLL